MGDLIDRGPSRLGVLELVKAIVDAGTAQVVMGNHEFNAVAYATDDPQSPGTFLRPHCTKSTRQHAAFLEQLTDEQRSFYVEWIRTFLLWLDLDELRIIHACWHQPSINLIEEKLGGNRFNSNESFSEAARTTTPPSPLYAAIETVLKGPELSLAKYGAKKFLDKDGHARGEARVRWWRDGVTTLKEFAEVPQGASDEAGQPYGELPDVLLDGLDQSYTYEAQVPVIYGHYWRTGVPLEFEDWTCLTACVDFSAVKGGVLVAYRWNGERAIDSRNYHPHGRNFVDHSPLT